MGKSLSASTNNLTYIYNVTMKLEDFVMFNMKNYVELESSQYLTVYSRNAGTKQIKYDHILSVKY